MLLGAPLAIVYAVLGGAAKHVADVPAGHALLEDTLRFARDGAHVAYVAEREGSFHRAEMSGDRLGLQALDHRGVGS